MLVQTQQNSDKNWRFMANFCFQADISGCLEATCFTGLDRHDIPVCVKFGGSDKSLWFGNYP
jgi:hypothetical protein